jgi:hypothetical protein
MNDSGIMIFHHRFAAMDCAARMLSDEFTRIVPMPDDPDDQNWITRRRWAIAIGPEDEPKYLRRDGTIE